MTQTNRDAITDVQGVRVGHATRDGDGWLTGTTVVLAPEGGAVAAVDVRGGGPGTRETDALDPRNLVQRVDAIVLTGGSAYGLDSASGVMAWLEEQGRGFPVGGPGKVVPVVPAACVYDLGRGGSWRARPDASFGREAAEAASEDVRQGCVGAGTGAVAGGLKGGIGTASTRLASGHTLGALVVVNAVGEVTDPRTGTLYGRYFTAPEGHPADRPSPETHHRARLRLAEARSRTAELQAATGPGAPLNTTLAVVATDAALTKAQAQKLAGTAHDGIARAVRPVHLLHDGDTVFALATGRKPLPDGELEALLTVNELLAAAADTVTRAIVKAVEAAESVRGPGGEFPSYAELYRRTDG
ncbi:P1 family peptidase [Streptomyces sp. TRM66268-LWL]|uniref:P1 family peptidase n=1 Tax=Streptomyces polyasparticus TaxID=2767826 RepID=A0ABR7SPJ2_9ACTN|nr:P1 family peptidase [Streptomyces polyasparticus]MBC9716882.1 P1 family peptidase [Streptomyces polyasparticus]